MNKLVIPFLIALFLTAGCIQDGKDREQSFEAKPEASVDKLPCAGGSCPVEMPHSTPQAQSCEYAKDLKEKENCILNNARNLGKGDLCENLTLLRDECFFEAARNTGSGCDRLSTRSGRDVCYKEAAFQSVNLSLCEFIQNEPLRRWCGMHFEGTVQDRAVCDFGSGEHGWETYFTRAKEQCVIDVVKATGNEALCRTIKGYEEGYECTRAYAKAKNDPSVCDAMLNPGWRDRCRESVR